MGKLKDTILEPNVRPSVIKDCASLVDAEVGSKTGVSGMLVKTSYKAFTAIKPSMVSTAVDTLLDDFAGVLDTYHERFAKQNDDGSQSFDRWVTTRDADLADDLLKVTDNLINQSSKTAIKKIYNGLRKTAAKHVKQAVPAVGQLVTKYVS